MNYKIQINKSKIDIFKLANEELKKDKEFIKEIVNSHPKALFYIEVENFLDEDFILELISTNKDLLKYLSNNLKENITFMIKALSLIGINVEDKKVKNNKELILSIVKDYPETLEYSTWKLQHDKEFILEAINQNFEISKYLPERMKYMYY